MLQRYIRALPDFSVNVKTYQPSISSAVAGNELNNPLPSDCAKKCQQMSAFPTVCRGSLQVVTSLFSAIVILHVRLGG